MIKYKIKEEYLIDIKNYFLVVKSFEDKKSLIEKFIDFLILKSIIKKVNI